eukprot:TRINITY_DN31878_c0_g1_i1.p1 TRINITY_DN31878_c0_g1~~TRINITY_DN31878_c0_g1_i1.p1  ORF type:complete len:209 (+),score=3.05 TRINITY_DN31878_c0_g1_i1:130-756(+)
MATRIRRPINTRLIGAVLLSVVTTTATASVFCTVPEPKPNAVCAPYEPGDELPAGTGAWYVCNCESALYESPQGQAGISNWRECQSDGTWTVPEWECYPFCYLASSYQPGSTQHNHSTPSFVWSEEVVGYSCVNNGTKPRQGDTVRTCQADGTFTGSNLVCERKYRLVRYILVIFSREKSPALMKSIAHSRNPCLVVTVSTVSCVSSW